MDATNCTKRKPRQGKENAEKCRMVRGREIKKRTDNQRKKCLGLYSRVFLVANSQRGICGLKCTNLSTTHNVRVLFLLTSTRNYWFVVFAFCFTTALLKCVKYIFHLHRSQYKGYKYRSCLELRLSSGTAFSFPRINSRPHWGIYIFYGISLVDPHRHCVVW